MFQNFKDPQTKFISTYVFIDIISLTLDLYIMLTKFVFIECFRRNTKKISCYWRRIGCLINENVIESRELAKHANLRRKIST